MPLRMIDRGRDPFNERLPLKIVGHIDQCFYGTGRKVAIRVGANVKRILRERSLHKRVVSAAEPDIPVTFCNDNSRAHNPFVSLRVGSIIGEVLPANAIALVFGSFPPQ
ncbi:hypothetical protein D9M72_633360 [compost metagenome]